MTVLNVEFWVLGWLKPGELALIALLSCRQADEILQLLTRQRKLDFETLEDIAIALGIPMEFFIKEEEGDEFVKLARDPRLTEAENAVLVERLSEMREALTELLFKKRQKSHGRDFVAG